MAEIHLFIVLKRLCGELCHHKNWGNKSSKTPVKNNMANIATSNERKVNALVIMANYVLG